MTLAWLPSYIFMMNELMEEENTKCGNCSKFYDNKCRNEDSVYHLDTRYESESGCSEFWDGPYEYRYNRCINCDCKTWDGCQSKTSPYRGNSVDYDHSCSYFIDKIEMEKERKCSNCEYHTVGLECSNSKSPKFGEFCYSSTTACSEFKKG